MEGKDNEDGMMIKENDIVWLEIEKQIETLLSCRDDLDDYFYKDFENIGRVKYMMKLDNMYSSINYIKQNFDSNKCVFHTIKQKMKKAQEDNKEIIKENEALSQRVEEMTEQICKYEETEEKTKENRQEETKLIFSLKLKIDAQEKELYRKNEEIVRMENKVEERNFRIQALEKEISEFGKFKKTFNLYKKIRICSKRMTQLNTSIVQITKEKEELHTLLYQKSEEIKKIKKQNDRCLEELKQLVDT